MRVRLASLIAVIAAAHGLACGSSSSDAPSTNGDDTGAIALDSGGTLDGTPGDLDTAPTDDAASDTIASAYPEGPYGIKTGDIMEDFEMSGYLNLDSSQVSTAVEYKTLRLSDVRAAAKVPYLFIHEVGFF